MAVNNYEHLIALNRRIITELCCKYDDTPKSDRKERLKIQIQVLELKKEIKRLEYMNEAEEDAELILKYSEEHDDYNDDYQTN